MKFGYFTLSDNHYSNNPRSPNQCVMDLVDEAIYAESIGLNSAWIGEHHFNSLGVLSCPDIALAYIAARTQRIPTGARRHRAADPSSDPGGRAMGDARSLERRASRFRHGPRL